MNTQIKTVMGMVSDGVSISRAPITVRFTHDNRGGESLSLEYGGRIFGVAYEDIKPIIEKARKGKVK